MQKYQKKSMIDEGTVCDQIASNIDFLPKFARLAGVELDKNKIIDGVDMTSLLFQKHTENYKRDSLFYYHIDNLEAVRSGKWKLHFRKRDREINELYNLETDIGETRNLYNEYPDIVEKLNLLADECREDLGDNATNIKGKNIRPAGYIENPKMLTVYNPEHPYIIAIYDKD